MTFQFSSLSDFLAMGQHGFYVWLAYGISFFTVGALIWLSKNEPKRILSEVKKAQIRAARMQKGK